MSNRSNNAEPSDQDELFELETWTEDKQGKWGFELIRYTLYTYRPERPNYRVVREREHEPDEETPMRSWTPLDSRDYSREDAVLKLLGQKLTLSSECRNFAPKLFHRLSVASGEKPIPAPPTGIGMTVTNINLSPTISVCSRVESNEAHGTLTSPEAEASDKKNTSQHSDLIEKPPEDFPQLILRQELVDVFGCESDESLSSSLALFGK